MPAPSYASASSPALTQVCLVYRADRRAAPEVWVKRGTALLLATAAIAARPTYRRVALSSAADGAASTDLQDDDAIDPAHPDFYPTVAIRALTRILCAAPRRPSRPVIPSVQVVAEEEEEVVTGIIGGVVVGYSHPHSPTAHGMVRRYGPGELA